jgi:hemolysin activation/secretion protein
MKCVSNQDADMQVMPIDAPSERDVLVTVKHAKPWSVVASVNDSGTRATGI